jgi:1,4-dihydroxy-6-naphthoate synthase
LYKVADLGDVWEQKVKAPIPLGGIAVKRNIEKNVAAQVDKLIKKVWNMLLAIIQKWPTM